LLAVTTSTEAPQKPNLKKSQNPLPPDLKARNQ
jgi:hypothetical protein